jgi:hypothetical protein
LEQVKAQQAAYPARQQQGHVARQQPPNNLETPGLPSKGRTPAKVLPRRRPEAADVTLDEPEAPAWATDCRFFDIMPRVGLVDKARTGRSVQTVSICSLPGRGLQMIKGLLTSMGLAGLVAASVVQGAVAAPTAPAISEIIAPHGRSLEQVYYYNGRHYPYRYNNRYYAHRAYRHGHWHYY